MDTCILLLVHVLAMLSWLITECLVCWLRPSATLVILDWVLISVSDTDNILIDIFIIFVQINFSSRLQCFPFSACTCDSSHYIIVLTVIVTQCQRSLFKIIYPVYIFYLQSMFDIFTMQWIWHFLIPCVSSQIYTLVPTHGVLCLLSPASGGVWCLSLVQWYCSVIETISDSVESGKLWNSLSPVSLASRQPLMVVQRCRVD